MSKSNAISRVNGPAMNPGSTSQTRVQPADSNRGSKPSVPVSRTTAESQSIVDERQLTEQIVKDQIHILQQFGSRWARFAVHAVSMLDDSWRDAFTHHGAIVPEEFLQPYRELADERHALLASIANTLFQGAGDWQPPKERESLHDWENSLCALQRLLHERDRQARDERRRLLAVVDQMKRIAANAPECASMRSEVAATSTSLAATTQPVSDSERDHVRNFEFLLRLIMHETAQRPEIVADGDLLTAAVLSDARYDEVSAFAQSHFGGSVLRAVTLGKITCTAEQLAELSTLLLPGTNLASAPIVAPVTAALK